MKIIEGDQTQLTGFKTVKPGECFRVPGTKNLYMKLAAGGSAVNLDSDTVSSFCSSDFSVVLYDVELTVKGVRK